MTEQPTTAAPVVHFEIIGRDPAALRAFYASLFGWQLEPGAPVAAAVSDQAEYAFLDAPAAPPDRATGGIPGGLGGGTGFAPHAIFYVGVPDVEATLAKAVQLGGERVLGPALNAAAGIVIGHLRDPEGTLIGVAGPA